MESSTELKQGIIQKERKKTTRRNSYIFKKTFLTLNRVDSNNSSGVFCFLTSVNTLGMFSSFVLIFLSYGATDDSMQHVSP